MGWGGGGGGGGGLGENVYILDKSCKALSVLLGGGGPSPVSWSQTQ